MEFDSQIVFQSIIAEDENQNNVKIGDIIYLKSYLPDDNKGIISGEGFGTNKLECLLMQKNSQNELAYKQAELNIFTCLFKVISIDQQKNDLTQSSSENKATDINLNRKDAETEAEQSVIYGQEIQLVHLYSKSFVTVNSQVLAKENCCRELRLESVCGQHSSFMFSSNTKNYGESVLYGDILFFKSSVPHLNQWGLGIQSNYPHTEVHASQLPYPLKICCYHEQFENEHQIMNGDIIIFKNRLFGGFLSVRKEQSILQYLSQRQIIRNDKQVRQNHLNVDNMKNQHNVNQLYKLYLDHEVGPNSMWQLLGITQKIQKKDKVQRVKTYLVKNVLTGAFLLIDDDQLHLTFEQISSKCQFALKNLQKTNQTIQIGEFYRLILNQNGSTLQCENNCDVAISQHSEKAQFDQQLFQVKRGPFDDAISANKIQQFYQHSLQFFLFLQDWGLDQQFSYQYNLAFYQQKQLQDEINSFYSLLKNIGEFLTLNENVSLIKNNQYLLCKYDILDLLIIIQQQITLMTYQELQIESTFNDKSVSRIARQKFSPSFNINKRKQTNLATSIYELMFDIIFDNTDCCNYLIEKDSRIDYLFSQLSISRVQIEKILMQAVSKAEFSEYIALKWIKKLKPITEENLEDQIFIMEIINNLVSFQNKISVQCQNLCRKQLFTSQMKSSNGQQQNFGCLLKCQISTNQLPMIQFLIDEQIFSQQNRSICELHSEQYQSVLKNQIILEFFMKYGTVRTVAKYEHYIMSILSLFSRMCKGRNHKNMAIIKTVTGITQGFLDSFFSSTHSLQSKTIVIDLFTTIYFDIDPLTKISTFENTCYLRREIMDFDKEQESGRYFYENISSRNMKKTESYQHFQQSSLGTEENVAEFLQLRAFSFHIVTRQKYHEYYIQLFLQLDYPVILIKDSDSELDYKGVANRQLQFFLRLVRIIKDSIELGYNTLATNRQIQETLQYIFITLIIQQKNKFQFCHFNEEVAFNRNLEEVRRQIKPQLKLYETQFSFNFENSWITEFLLWTTSLSDNTELLEHIFSEALDIYRVLFYLQANLQILNYLSQKNCKASEMFSNHNTLLFHCLFGESRLLKLNHEILEYLILSFNQQMYNLKEIKEVEILDDNTELKYFSLVNGHSQNQDIIGPKEIQHNLKKALKYITSSRHSQVLKNELEEQFNEVEKYLMNINALFEETMSQNRSYLHSLQNMIRNAGIHKIFLAFLFDPTQIRTSNSVVYFYRRLIKFFENFSKNNSTNFTILIPYLNSLLKMILIPQPEADNFTYQSLQLSKLELWKAPGTIIGQIIDISKNLDLKKNIVHIRAARQYFKILKGLTRTPANPGFNILSNQRLILHLLLQHFRDLMDPINYFGDLENFSKLQSTIPLDILHFQQLKLHATILFLVAETCQNYNLGIQEAQRVLIFEQLISILQYGPYIVKGAYLKCIFELYINFVKLNNQAIDTIDNSQTKELLNSIIIPDLEQMSSFSNGTQIYYKILVSNNEYWKYVYQIIIFIILLLDEYRDHERQKYINIIKELQQIQQQFQGLLLNSSIHFVEQRKELMLELIDLISVFQQLPSDFGLQKRILLYCIRHDTSVAELIYSVESTKSRNNFEKLKEICNQHNKVYITKEDMVNSSLCESEELQSFATQWNDFKKQLSCYIDQTNIISQTQGRECQEKALENLKEEFQIKKEEEVKFRFAKSMINLENYELLSEDIQIMLLILDLQNQDNGELTLKGLKSFLIQCKSIFIQHPIYLIKICKILLELKKPDKIAIKQNLIEEFAQYQDAIAESEMDILSIESLVNSDMPTQLDALTLLQSLLDFGNYSVQQRLYQLMQNHKKLKKTFIQFCKELFSMDINLKLEELRQSQSTIYFKTCLKLLQVLQGLCENVHLEFQRFLKVQNVMDSITTNLNFIFETTNLLANLLSDQTVDNSKKWELYQQGMFSLIEFSTGLMENKKEITKNTRFFTSFNKFLNDPNIEFLLQPLDKTHYQNSHYQFLQTISIYIKLIISMLEGDAKDSRGVFKFLLETLDINVLLLLAKNIYQIRIVPKKKIFCVDKYCRNPCKTKCCSENYCINRLKTQEDDLLIQTGLNIFIIGLKLSNFSDDDRYNIFRFENDIFDQDFFGQVSNIPQVNLKDLTEKTFSMPSHPTLFYKVVNDDVDDLSENIQQQIKIVNPIKRSDEFFEFYRQFVGRIEVVNQNGQIERILFQKPFVCKYITSNIKFHLIYESNRETDEDRIASLIENIDFFHSQMKHYQHISNFALMHFGQRHWRRLKDISYIICVFIVMFFILMPGNIIDGNLYQGDTDTQLVNETKTAQVVLLLNNIITIIQLILNLMIIIFCAIERYPIAINFSSSKTNARRIQVLKKEAGFKIPNYKMHYYDFIGYLENNFENQQIKSNNFKRMMLLLLIDFDNLYNIIIFGITIIAFFNTYVYAILLLDIVKRSEDLQNIIKAITENAKNLLLFGLLGLIGLLLYGFLMKLSFSGDFQDDSAYASDSLGYSIAHVINFGLRNGGGIGDTLQGYKNPFHEPSEYWSRYFFDFTFFIIFNILFIQMVFGIIVDKFGELRDQRQDLIKDIQGKCFICSMERNEVDSKTKSGWHFHIYLEHNVYHMLYYLIYIKGKPITECNSLEKFIKDQINNKESDFFPVHSTYEIQSNENNQ